MEKEIEYRSILCNPDNIILYHYILLHFLPAIPAHISVHVICLIFAGWRQPARRGSNLARSSDAVFTRLLSFRPFPTFYLMNFNQNKENEESHRTKRVNVPIH